MPSAPPRWAAPLAAAVACSAFALWNPPLRDLAAHTFRAEFFEDHGFAIWNNTWYGGHYMLVLQRAVPPAGGTAVARVGGGRRGGHERVAVRSHRACALGGSRRLGRAVVRRARCGGAARERVAGVRARRRLRARRAARAAGRPARLRPSRSRPAARSRAPWRPRSSPSCARSACSHGAARRLDRNRCGSADPARGAGAAVPRERAVPVLVLGVVAAGPVLHACADRHARDSNASATCAR